MPVFAASIELSVVLETEGENLILSAGTRRLFDDPAAVWFVRDGLVEFYAVQRRDGRQVGPREYLGAVAAGDLIWGVKQSVKGDGVHILALMCGDVRLSRLSGATVARLGRDDPTAGPLVAALDVWISFLLQGVTGNVAARGAPRRSIAGEEALIVEKDDRVAGRKGVVWAELVDGTGLYLDIQEIGLSEKDRLAPLTPRSWLREAGVRNLRGHATQAVLGMEDPVGRMAMFHAWVLHLLGYGFRNAASAEIGRLGRRADRTARDVERTLAGFVNLVNLRRLVPQEVAGEDALLESCRLVGKAADLTIIAPPSLRRRRREERAPDIDDIAAASGLRVRRVLLRDRWWKEDGGPLVGFLLDGDRSVALLPQSATAYILHDPVTAQMRPVTAEVAAGLWPGAFVFYPSLPARPLTPMDLVRFAGRRCRGDLLAVLLTGAVGGLIASALPMATAYVFDTVVAGHQSLQLLQVGLALVVAAFSAAVFRFSCDIAQLRVEGKVAGVLQAAFMDRLLRLPNGFFADYSTGDLSQRTLVVEVIRRTVTGVVLGSLMSGVFSIFSFGLLFYYSPAAALVASALALILAGVTAFTGFRLLDAAMRSEESAGVVNSMVLEIITGIVKLRLAGAEDRAFTAWGKDFTAQRSARLQVEGAINGFGVFWSGFEVLGLAVMFAVVARLDDGALSTGGFLAFIAAFSGFFAALHAMAQSVLTVFSIAPKYRRAEPILRATPEITANKTDPGVLSGGFEINGAAFRYSPNGPRILNGLSINVNAGEFVALVGPSGCGKSTLMRLLLGLARPEAGGVYFDGKDLRGLNLQSVRRQIGVVLQNSRLTPGTIYDNIKGATRATLDDCREAAAMTGLDQDIEAMPMNMHTMLTEGTSTLSGGQIQRILLARAIVGKPRILLLDEATSALDNLTQAVVIDSLDRLSMTRFVIAHRLSTIIKADCIHVLNAGRIVESGGYDQLIRQGGLFSEFSRRQHL
jgi:NHLM bacteriocin system ABC transporter ATP-binding protein